MKFIINKENLLSSLQQIVNVIEKRQTMPILSNVLLKINDNDLIMTGTDLEVQIISKVIVESKVEGEITIPARKFFDICKSLPIDAPIKFEVVKDKMKIQSGRSRFLLSTLSANDYPNFSESEYDCQFTMSSGRLKKAFDKTIFSMAHQDVRYYLNGLMLNLSNHKLKLVASDGHRLSVYKDEINQQTGIEARIIIPRKCVLELSRLLDDSDTEVVIEFSKNNFKAVIGNVIFSAKLIDSKYPEYNKVFLQDFFDPIVIQKQILKDALTRVAILSNEKFKGISLDISSNNLKISTHNPEHEEAEEELSIEFDDEVISVAFNAHYLLDAVSNLDSDLAILTIASNASCCFIEDPNNQQYRFIIMPMKL